MEQVPSYGAGGRTRRARSRAGKREELFFWHFSTDAVVSGSICWHRRQAWDAVVPARRFLRVVVVQVQSYGAGGRSVRARRHVLQGDGGSFDL